jgi:hypothetical protein
VTAPLDDDPRAGFLARSVAREIVGLLCVLVGFVVLVVLLGSVDWRWAVGMGAAALIAGGLWLGRGTDDEGE